MQLQNLGIKQPCYTVLSGKSEISYQIVEVSLSELDNDLSRFWKTFTNAFFVWNVAFAQQLRSEGLPDTDKKNASFLEKLEKIAKQNPLIIMIRDKNLIHNSFVQKFLMVLAAAEQYPHFLVLLLTSDRVNATIHTAIQTNRFRYFSLQEEWDYYNGQGVELNSAQFHAAHSFTEGWAAAVILLAQRLLLEDKPTVFADFSGYIYRWIADHYGKRFLDEERSFCCCLALLDEFPVEFVRDSLEWESEATLQIFEGTPFLRFNPESNRFYLGKDLRRHALKVLSQDMTKKEQNRFLIRAGDWYREQGDRINAIACYRKAGNNKKVLQVIQQWTFPTPRDLARCYVEAIQALPASFVERHPLLYPICAFCLYTLGRYDEGEALVEAFCVQHDMGQNTPEDIRLALGEAYLAWGHRSKVQCDSGKALRCMRRAAELLPDGSILVQEKASFYADKPVLMLPGPEAGSVEKDVAYQQELSRLTVILTNGSFAGGGALASAEWHYFTRNFQKVVTYSNAALSEALEWSQYDMICSVYFLLMRFYMAKGNYERLMDVYQKLKEFAAKAQFTTFFTMPGLADSWLALKLGRRYEVAGWILDDKLNQEFLSPWNYGWDQVLYNIFLMENRSYGEIVSRVDDVPESFFHNWWRIPVLQMKLIQAFAYHGLGEEIKAFELFELVYYWLHANHLIMLFVEFGSHIVSLITAYRKAGQSKIPADWLDLTEKKAKSYQMYVYSIRRKHQAKTATPVNTLECLTPLEEKVLRLLAEGLTVEKIAEHMNRKASTMKTILFHIYAKLGVSGKDEAVQVALQDDFKIDA